MLFVLLYLSFLREVLVCVLSGRVVMFSDTAIAAEEFCMWFL